MQPYRLSTRIKLALVVAAVAIGVGSMLITGRLADRLQEQDEAAVELWARAIEYQAQSVANESELGFVFSEIVEPARFSVPAVITDEDVSEIVTFRNVTVDSSRGVAAVRERLLREARAMDASREPIRFELAPGVTQLVHYGDSPLARVLRWFPLVQLLVIALLVGVGYVGFSYIRRTEQSLLWVGLAREAAHQMGTPLSSMIGWIELLRLEERTSESNENVAEELQRDVDRLRRVADRFEQIGSEPALEERPLAPLLHGVADYMRQRFPRHSAKVVLDVQADESLVVRVNPGLFEWVIENLIKNALDAIGGEGKILITATADDVAVVIQVQDTGRGMDRATARHLFRPGFSTKRRGWGLGLSLARRIVKEYHGGRLELVHTRPGEGTVFEIRLPMAGNG